jgi:hypothetical protein
MSLATALIRLVGLWGWIIAAAVLAGPMGWSVLGTIGFLAAVDIVLGVAVILTFGKEAVGL